MKCASPGCTTQLTSYNESERCYVCRALLAATQRYVEEREIKVTNVDRWSAGQTNKKHLRLPYLRKLAKKKVIPWDATLEEIELVDPDGFKEMHSDLSSLSFFKIFYTTGRALDERIHTFTYDEACCVETHFPESNFLTKWHVVTNGGVYKRFRSVADEEPKRREEHYDMNTQEEEWFDG